ncbi:MAG TPA: hypothetical protein VGJ37_07055 [Pyrinomonadaceae bacterium]|jgi:hypothetical protein
MDTSESKVHSFIVKLWLDETADKSRKPAWHGYITHVPDGERRYLKRLSEMVDFVKRYLDDAVTEPGVMARLRSRFRRLN